MRTIKEEKRIKRLSKSKVNFRIFLLFCFSIIGLTVGYSALNEELKISGEASVRPIKDVRITDVRLSETTNEGQFNYNNFSVNSISLGASLPNINSTVTYEVDISNIGNVPIIIKSITPEYGENSNIEYVITGIKVGETKINTNANKTDDDMGLPTTIKVTVKYKDGISQVPSDISAELRLNFEFIIGIDSILAKSTGDSDTSVFKNTNITRDKIKTIEFKGTIDVPEEIPDSNIWDASLNNDKSVIAYYTVNSATGLYNLVIGGYGKVQFPSLSFYLFKEYTNLESINFGSYIDTSEVTDMSFLFYGCSSLKDLDLNSFNTSKVTYMSSMFYNCSKLPSLNLSSFNTSEVINMSLMFYNCSKLPSLNLSNFDTSSVTDMSFMFYGCSSLTGLDLNSFNTSQVTNMMSMFNRCSNLESLNLSSFNTADVMYMNSMFYNCSKLKRIDLSSFNTSKVTGMTSMFYGCSILESLNLSNFDTSNVTDMRFMFQDCSSLVNLNLSSFTNQINIDTAITKTESIFYNCSKLEELHLESWNFSSESGDAIDISGIPSTVNLYIAESQVNNFNAFIGFSCNIIGV